MGVAVYHGDLRQASDLEPLPAADWVIEAAAQPSVLAGVQGGFSSRRLFEHNLVGLGNVLEFCKDTRAGLVLLSSSRVYSIAALQSLPLRDAGNAFQLDVSQPLPRGSRPRASAALSPPTRRSPSMAARSWPPRPWRWSGAPPSASRFGSTAAACWPARGSSARPTRGSSRTGSTPICAGGRCATSVSAGKANRSGMRCTRATWPPCSIRK